MHNDPVRGPDIDDDGLPPPPPAAERPVAERYHGHEVVDPYRWLESTGDPEVRAWLAAQNTHARRWLDAWPGREALRSRLTELMAAGSPSYAALREAGGMLFAVKRQPPLEQAMLVVMASADDPSSERVLVDPNAIDPSGGTSIDWFEPAFDGRRVAVSLSSGGTESGDVHVFETRDGRKHADVITRVNGGTAGGSLAWNAGGTAFTYTRYPSPGERPPEDLPFYVQIYAHEIGADPASDRYELGRAFSKIAEIRLEGSRDGRHVLATVQDGDGGDFEHWLREPGGGWRRIARYEDRWAAACLGDDVVFAVSFEGAPRGSVVVLPLDPAADATRARTIVAEETDAIQTSFAHGTGIWCAADRLYVLYQKGGPNAVKAFDTSGQPLGEIATPPLSVVDDVAVRPGGEALVSSQSLTRPPCWLRVTRGSTVPRPTALAEDSPADFSACEVVRDEAVSRDGTRVPITILKPRGIALDGESPAILYGYGGYGICATPAFRGRLRAWTERGGIYAIAHLRGGGERGDRWHRDGHRLRKQNVFDDFAACAWRLVAAGYTARERLALLGGSNGGLLMGAMITQLPELAGAVVSLVGVYDMLRVEQTANGAFNVTEFGSVADPAMFRVLHAYSPYHNVRDGVAYPPVLLLAGENDPRVDPWHSFKMAARLARATSSGNSVLLRTNPATGHGMGTALSHQVEEFTDVLTFICRTLGA